MGVRLKDEMKHAGVGLLLGLIGLVFGLSWAVYITANHDGIHRRLRQAERASIEEKFVINSGGGHEGHEMSAGRSAQAGHASHSEGEAVHDHSSHNHEAAAVTGPSDDGMELMRKELAQIRADIAKRSHGDDHHATPDMAKAHERLAKAHVHAMGLGILSIAVSVMLGLLPAPARAKTFAAACVGTGGLFYPLSWILMGMRTTAMGAAGAEASVLPMAGLSVILVGIGIVLAFIYTARWLLSRS